MQPNELYQPTMLYSMNRLHTPTIPDISFLWFQKNMIACFHSFKENHLNTLMEE